MNKEQFAVKQRELNPAITEEQITAAWMLHPDSKVVVGIKGASFFDAIRDLIPERIAFAKKNTPFKYIIEGIEEPEAIGEGKKAWYRITANLTGGSQKSIFASWLKEAEKKIGKTIDQMKLLVIERRYVKETDEWLMEYTEA